MPIIGEQYVTPNWQNNSRPPINAEELLAIGAAIEGNPPLGAVIQVSYNEDEGGEG